MRSSITREFHPSKPRAIVLDDHGVSRKMTARRLRTRGFDVSECSNVNDFHDVWRPGTFDVIVADWELSKDPSKHGDRMLLEVRRRDWDVPFVLVSGKLDEESSRAQVLQSLLQSGSARFVRRGSNGIRQACDDAEDLIERRDLTLLKMVLSLRDGALSGAKIQTSTGYQLVSEQLEALVSRPRASHEAGRPIAERRSARAIRRTSASK